MLLEIATTDFITTQQAVDGGADRIELCTALSEGGITPSYGLIRQVRERFSIPVFPIIRPRGGDFLYSADEFAIMIRDAKMCKELGCDGIVTGMLLADGHLDVESTSKLIAAVYPLEVSFHRAFDRCVDPFLALEQLVDLGCQRILTSGQKPTAPEGADLIRQLVETADHRIIIMPGSGVRPDNIESLVQTTGASEYHTSLRSKAAGGMLYHHPAFPEADYINAALNVEELKAMKKLLEKF